MASPPTAAPLTDGQRARINAALDDALMGRSQVSAFTYAPLAVLFGLTTPLKTLPEVWAAFFVVFAAGGAFRSRASARYLSGKVANRAHAAQLVRWATFALGLGWGCFALIAFAHYGDDPAAYVITIATIAIISGFITTYAVQPVLCEAYLVVMVSSIAMGAFFVETAAAYVLAGGAVFFLYIVGRQTKRLRQEFRDHQLSLMLLQEARDEASEGRQQLEQTRDALEEALARAEEATRTKSMFLANMSHELRTPMTGVLGIGELLLNAELTREQRELVQVLIQSGEGLVSIVNDILDFSRMEAGRLELDEAPFELTDAVEPVARMLAPRAVDKGVELVCCIAHDVPSVIRGDANRLRQVIINLVGNALKFTDAGQVALIVERVDTTPQVSTVRFEVRDTGVGIPAEQQERMFEAFAQADPETSRGGTGLGLAISRELVQLMGGTIELESSVGEGSCFAVTIPFKAYLEAARSTDVDVTLLNRLAGIVAHNPLERRGLEEALRSAGIRVRSWASVDEAVAELEPGRLDVIYAVVGGAVEDLEDLARLREAAALPPGRVTLLVPFAVTRTAWATSGSVMLRRPARRRDIARAFESMMKGTSLAESFDVSVATMPHLAEVPRPPRSDAPPWCLVVDDNPINRRVLVNYLAELGLDSDTAEDGVEAVERANASPYRAILMDCQMPGMDGFEATRQIRAGDGPNCDAPIIAVTAIGRELAAEKAEQSGFSDWISKPIRRGDIARFADRWIADLPHDDDVAADTRDVPLLEDDGLAMWEQLDPVHGAELARQLAQIFVEDAPARLEAVRRALTARDWRAAATAIADLRASAANIGAARLVVACDRFTSACDDDDIDALEGLAEQLDRVVRETSSALREAEPSPNRAAGAPT